MELAEGVKYSLYAESIISCGADLRAAASALSDELQITVPKYFKGDTANLFRQKCENAISALQKSARSLSETGAIVKKIVKANTSDVLGCGDGGGGSW